MQKNNILIGKVNDLLVKRFGIPARNNNLPDPLDLLIATILSQNTNDNNSFKAFQNLKTRFKSWEDVIGIKRSELEKIIKVAGLGKQKSQSIKNLLAGLSERGELSLRFIEKLSDEEAIGTLTKFKGVGVKTASCVLLFALDRNVCPVDTHVHRTVNRIGIVSERTPDKTFYSLNERFPKNIAHSFHTNLIRLGREVCKPSKPNCPECPILKVCAFIDKNLNKVSKSSEKKFMLLDNI